MLRPEGKTCQNQLQRAQDPAYVRRSGAGSVLSDMANLGMTLGAMGSVVNMTKEALNPMMQSASEMGSSVVGAAMAGGWDCACGTKNIATNFCPNCGEKLAQTEKFCPNCGFDLKNISLNETISFLFIFYPYFSTLFL